MIIDLNKKSNYNQIDICIHFDEYDSLQKILD